jgi:hypothetical protein
MPVGTYEYRSEAERAAIERAIAFVTQLNDLALTTPPGHVLDACEFQALTAGRDLLRASLQQAVQSYVDCAEEKKRSRGNATADGPVG